MIVERGKRMALMVKGSLIKVHLLHCMEMIPRKCWMRMMSEMGCLSEQKLETLDIKV
jgi:hypothetical protein